jgi:hypothetical protein
MVGLPSTTTKSLAKWNERRTTMLAIACWTEKAGKTLVWRGRERVVGERMAQTVLFCPYGEYGCERISRRPPVGLPLPLHRRYR